MQSTYQSTHYQLSVAAVVLLLLAATVYAGDGRGAEPSKRIQGGKNVSIKKYPWIVSLEVREGRVCGGVAISKTWVVTAAHCLRGSGIFIRSSTSLARKGGRIHQVKQTIVHPKFYHPLLDYDIGLVEIKKPFKWSCKLKPASLATKNPDAGTWTTAAGWGKLKVNGTRPKVLQAADMQIQDWNECRKTNIYGEKIFVTERKICTNDKSRSTAKGDSGGPLTIHGSNELVGICSTHEERLSPTMTSFFTSIANLRGWIEQETGV